MTDVTRILSAIELGMGAVWNANFCRTEPLELRASVAATDARKPMFATCVGPTDRGHFVWLATSVDETDADWKDCVVRIGGTDRRAQVD